ncbi:MAG: VOC family protein [Terracidiphilus sp.]
MRPNRSIPSCTVIPVLGYPEIGPAIEWLCDAFGFTLRLRIGDHRAQLNVGDGAVILSQREITGPQDFQSVLVRVDDVDAHLEHAQNHGARVLSLPRDHMYGERQYNVADFAGHRWTFSQSIADVDPVTWGGTPGQL